MSKLKIGAEKRRGAGGASQDYTLVRLEGLIDAPNYMSFETAVDRLIRAGERRLIFDFRNVQYINSTGISAIIRFHNATTEHGGGLILIQVPRSVGLTMHLLGITSLVPFVKTLEDAETQFEQRHAKPPGKAEYIDDEAKSPKEIPVLATEPLKSRGSVAIAVPQQGAFTEILRARLGALNGNYNVINSIDDLRVNIDNWKPDLVVLDHRLGGVHDFIEELKINRNHSLTSVIVLYEKGSEVSHHRGFRVWENDYLIDPFELMNLFVLTETELRRVPRDRGAVAQQVHYQFDSIRPSVEKGLTLTNRLIQKVSLPETDKTALYAAVKEAIDNGVLHGNKHREELRITVNFLVDANKLTFIVEDEGDGFDYEYYLTQIATQEAFERAKERIRAGGRGGLGILLMHKCSDRLEYSGRGNIVRIEKNLK